MALYLDTSFFLSIVFEDANYEASYNWWSKDEFKFSSKLLPIESFININRIHREQRLDTDWLSNKLNRMEDLLAEINLIRVDDDIYQGLKSNILFTYLKSLDAIHLCTASQLINLLADELIICTYDNNMIRIAKNLGYRISHTDL